MGRQEQFQEHTPPAHQASSRGPLYPAISQSAVMVDKTKAERFVEGDEYVYTPN